MNKEAIVEVEVYLEMINDPVSKSDEDIQIIFVYNADNDTIEKKLKTEVFEKINND